MKLKNIQLKNVITFTVISCLYPAYKAISSENSLLMFIDSLTIISFILIIIGIINSFALHGDFDITAFAVNRKHMMAKSFDAFKEDRKKEREHSFNYPLFLGLVYLVICILLSVIFY